MRVPDGDGPPQERNTQEHKTEFCAKGVFRSHTARPCLISIPAVFLFRFIVFAPCISVQNEELLSRILRSVASTCSRESILSCLFVREQFFQSLIEIAAIPQLLTTSTICVCFRPSSAGM